MVWYQSVDKTYLYFGVNIVKMNARLQVECVSVVYLEIRYDVMVGCAALLVVLQELTV